MKARASAIFCHSPPESWCPVEPLAEDRVVAFRQLRDHRVGAALAAADARSSRSSMRSSRPTPMFSRALK